MIFLGGFEKITDTKYMVHLEHNNPSVLPKEIISAGFFVSLLPVIENKNGMSPTLFCNPNTKEVWYEYTPISKTDEQLAIEELSNQAIYNLDLDFRISKLELVI